MKHTPLFVWILSAVLVLSACTANPSPNRDIAIAVALTQTAAALAPSPLPSPTNVPTFPPGATPTLPPGVEAVRIQFAPNSTSWRTPGDLPANASRRFVLGAVRGQQMTIRLRTGVASDEALDATLIITGADGQVFTNAGSPTSYWSQVLPVTQDYNIEIRSLSEQHILYDLSIEIPAAVIDPALGNKYGLLDFILCRSLQEMTTEALGVEVTLEDPAPFLDPIAGEAGQGCRLTATGDGSDFSSPQEIIETLIAYSGFTEQPAYRADGPTGTAAGLARDMALMLVSARWEPAMGVECPADQPISTCDLLPWEKIYTIQIDAAEYLAGFSLDGHWEDPATGFTLELYQDWKNIYGQHEVIVRSGSKIDSLEASITGTLQGQVATVQFQSSFAPEPGIAEITYVDVSTIQWRIIDPPEGEFYLPMEATLSR